MRKLIFGSWGLPNVHANRRNGEPAWLREQPLSPSWCGRGYRRARGPLDLLRPNRPAALSVRIGSGRRPVTSWRRA